LTLTVKNGRLVEEVKVDFVVVLHVLAGLFTPLRPDPENLKKLLKVSELSALTPHHSNSS
jgi:hypothetical protein